MYKCYVDHTLNENIVLWGHDTNFKPDDTFDLNILLAILLYLQMQNPEKNIPQFHLFKGCPKTCFEAEKTHVAVVNMSYDKCVIDWYFYKDLMESKIMNF